MTLWRCSFKAVLFRPFPGRLPTNRMWTLFLRVSAGGIVFKDITHVWTGTLIYQIHILPTETNTLPICTDFLFCLIWPLLYTRPISPETTWQNNTLVWVNMLSRIGKSWFYETSRKKFPSRPKSYSFFPSWGRAEEWGLCVSLGGAIVLQVPAFFHF